MTDQITSMPSLMEQVSSSLSLFIAKSYDSLIQEAIEAKGWPLDHDYIKTHITRQPIPDGDRFWHDEMAFLEIKVFFNWSDPVKAKVTVVPKMLN